MPTTATTRQPRCARWSTVRCPIGGQAPSWCIPSWFEGTYDLMPKGTDDVRLTIQIRGGEVTTADWPSHRPSDLLGSAVSGKAGGGLK